MTLHDDGFDARVRSVHAASLDHLSARVNAQLAQRRRAALKGEAPRVSRGLLPWAGVATAALALALVVQLRPPGSGPGAPQPQPSERSVATTATAPSRALPDAQPRIAAVTPAPASRLPVATDVDAVTSDLSEDPEFYLWLGDERLARTE